MLDPIVVDTAALHPFVCVCCGGTNGPLVDFNREVRGWGRVYVCDLCVGNGARVRGLIRGKRYQEIRDRAQRVEELELTIRNLEERVEHQAAELMSNVRLFEEQESYKRWADGRIEQLSNGIRGEAADLLAVLGDPVLAEGGQ